MPNMELASEYVPRVTKSLVKGPEPDFSKFEFFRFKDSDTLLCIIRGLLHISFNNGGNWEIPNAFKNRLIHFGAIDLFHEGRAFVTSEGGKIHVTEDGGRNWKELFVPKAPDERIECRGVETHPIDRRLLLAKILVESIFPPNEVIYVSSDAGESFRRITTPDNCDETVPTLKSYDCHFAVSSKESTLERNGIYYISKTTYGKKPLTRNVFNHGRTTSFLFYTADFGKTTRSFDELSDCWIQEIFIFPSSVIVLTSEPDRHVINKLWVSEGGNFEPIPIPDGVAYFTSAYLLPLGEDFTSRYDQNRLLLYAKMNGSKCDDSLMLDLSNLNFSRNPMPSSDEASSATYFRQLYALKESYRGKFYPNRRSWCSEQHEHSQVQFEHFNDSETLIFVLDGSLHISFNSGESWQSVNGFKNVEFVHLDEFHHERAFVTSEGRRLHATEDQGRSWKELATPDEYTRDSMIYTHPIDRKLLLFNISTEPNERSAFCFSSSVVYASNDAGESCKRIAPPVNCPWPTPNFEYYRCYFAVCSKESDLDNNGIYYIRKATYAEEPELSEDNLTDQLESAEEVQTLLYTADFGETAKTFDELNDAMVKEIFIFPSCVIALTMEDKWEDKYGKTVTKQKLWISKGERFEPVGLPDEVLSLEQVRYFSQDGQKVLLLMVRVNDSEDLDVSRSRLILDPLSLGFSWRPLSVPRTEWHDGHVHITRSRYLESRNLKRTLWKQLETKTKDHIEANGASIQTRIIQVSFDNGKSWKNLRVVDPSGKYKHLFEGENGDVEHCSLQLSSFLIEEPTGIIMATGTVGRSCIKSDMHYMTFISRDGGVSWEVAFEFCVDAISLDFSNVIVAIGPGYKFYFSLDQGRTWNDYYLDESICLLKPVSYGPRYFEESILYCKRSFSVEKLGLKALFMSRREKKFPVEYVFYLIDFSNIFGGAACTKDDMERWYLSNGDCIDGKRYSFDRRKPDAKCLVMKTFQNLELHEEECES